MHRFVRHFLRFSAPLALTAVALVWSDPGRRPGRQDQDITDPTGTGGSSPTGLTKGDFDIQLMQKDGDTWKYFNRTVYDTFFNRARCQCDEPVRVVVRLDQRSVGKVGVGKRAEFRLRARRPDLRLHRRQLRQPQLQATWTPPAISAALITGGLTFDTTVRAIFRRDAPPAPPATSATGTRCRTCGSGWTATTPAPTPS